MAEETKNQPEVKRGNRKERVGEVVSNKMAKTIVVRVERRFPHPQYKKIVTAYKKFYAHDEKSEAKIGDTVRIEETRPLSKLKRWRLVEVVERNVRKTPWRPDKILCCKFVPVWMSRTTRAQRLPGPSACWAATRRMPASATSSRSTSRKPRRTAR